MRAGDDFLAQLCVEWEQAGRQAESHGIRVVIVRIGVVLDKEGGALRRPPAPGDVALLAEPLAPEVARHLAEDLALEDVTALAQQTARRADAVHHEAGRVRFLPPVTDPHKIVCVGLNYRDHAAESGAPIPRDPVVFSKFTTALIGPEAPIVLPPVSHKVDYEAELVIVIGKTASDWANASRLRSCHDARLSH